MEEEIEFYQNKEGLMKHQANVEAVKNLVRGPIHCPTNVVLN